MAIHRLLDTIFVAYITYIYILYIYILYLLYRDWIIRSLKHYKIANIFSIILYIDNILDECQYLR